MQKLAPYLERNPPEKGDSRPTTRCAVYGTGAVYQTLELFGTGLTMSHWQRPSPKKVFFCFFLLEVKSGGNGAWRFFLFLVVGRGVGDAKVKGR